MGKKFTRLTLKKVEAVLQSLEKGTTIEKACKDADLSRPTFYDWLHDDPANRERFDKIIDSRTLVVEDALFNNAVKGNVTAEIFWLKNRASDRWKDVQDLNVKGDISLAAKIKEARDRVNNAKKPTNS